MTTTPTAAALDDLEADPDKHAGAEVAPGHDLDVDTFAEDQS